MRPRYKRSQARVLRKFNGNNVILRNATRNAALYVYTLDSRSLGLIYRGTCFVRAVQSSKFLIKVRISPNATLHRT